jgi:class 3 adenylate cyclase
MANRRAGIQQFYDTRQGTSIFTKDAAASRYQFRGPAFSDTVVVRCDLNGYSAWAKDKPIVERVGLLDHFFSSVVPQLRTFGGIYFRDEGDCIVSVFSDYFQTGATAQSARAFCQAVVSKTYGADALSAKAVVACGQVAYFQKSHEADSEEWSAEGHPFVAAARLEQAIASKAHVVYFKEDFFERFLPNHPMAEQGGIYHWDIEPEKLRVEGLNLPGGWADVMIATYIAGGRVS